MAKAFFPHAADFLGVSIEEFVRRASDALRSHHMLYINRSPPYFVEEPDENQKKITAQRK